MGLTDQERTLRLTGNACHGLGRKERQHLCHLFAIPKLSRL